jgi:hypothetical protein
MLDLAMARGWLLAAWIRNLCEVHASGRGVVRLMAKIESTAEHKLV